MTYETQDLKNTLEQNANLKDGVGDVDISLILRALQSGENAAFSLSNIFYRQGDSVKQKIWSDARDTISSAIREINKLPHNEKLNGREPQN